MKFFSFVSVFHISFPNNLYVTPAPAYLYHLGMNVLFILLFLNIFIAVIYIN